jgi:YbgC/YbaW family acyl-CoA thioester hydrolase
MSEPLSETVFHIYPTDCDMLGHLNHASILGFLERARWAMFDHRLNPHEMMRQPAFPVVRHVDIGYRAQTLPGDDLAVRSGILRVGNTSLTIRQEARNLASHQLVAEAKLVVVAIDRAGKPVPVPDAWTADMPAWPETA